MSAPSSPALRSMLIARLLSLSASFASAIASAQSGSGTVPPPAERRPELKGQRGPDYVAAGGSSGSATAATSFVRCDLNAVCTTPLYVWRGALINDGATWDPDGCSVHWPYAQIRVKQHFQPTLRWVLVKDPSDPASYSFDKSEGIRLVAKFGHDPNNREKDLYKPTWEPGGTAFSLHNLNLSKKKNRTMFYEPVVYRMKSDGLTIDRQCNFSDPEVVNEN